MAGNPQVIYSAAGVAQAHLLAGALRDRGFEAMVANDDLQIGLGALPFGTASAPPVVVPASEAEEARRIALELINEKPHEPQPFQFRMRTMMYVVTGVAVSLGIARLTGWQLNAYFPILLYIGIGTLFIAMCIYGTVTRRKVQRED